jgi:hypothetical protein
VSPHDWNESSIGATGKRRLGGDEEADKKCPAWRKVLVVAPLGLLTTAPARA